jgi:hypothetical protein
MNGGAIPRRHWRSNGNDLLPTGPEALEGSFDAFPSWFLRIECDRCSKLQIVNQADVRFSDRTLRVILDRMRHDGCGGMADADRFRPQAARHMAPGHIPARRGRTRDMAECCSPSDFGAMNYLTGGFIRHASICGEVSEALG